MKFRTLLFMALLLATYAQSQTRWNLDASHSNVKFTVTYTGVAEMDGKFNSFHGTILSSKEDFTDAQIEFTVDVASIDTDNEKRDEHLRSDDFFNAEKYPKMTFRSTSFRKTGDRTYVLEGDLTIRDVTKRVKFDVTYGGTTLDARGNTRAGFVARSTINRFDYNLKWNKVVENVAVVGDQVQIRVNVTFVKATG
ncbi:MAG: YceI family protein [Chitinophagales bacterium]|nr:YceI family protein [Chitinophagales bacterium]MDW8427190.1 YceI family protein [Chitinophagales bacterium]